MKIPVLFVIPILVMGFQAAEAQNACSRVETVQEKKLVDKIIRTYHLYDCMDGTIREGLADSHCVPLANRLQNHACRLVKKGLPEAHIYDALNRRALTMVSFEKPLEVDLDGAPVAGDDRSPVVLTVFLCARCPFCRVIIPQIYQAVIEGRLSSRVRLHAMLYPIKGHPGSVEGGLALEAAARMGRFWDYLMVVYGQYNSYSVARLSPWADSIGLDRKVFDSLRADTSVYRKVSDSKKEGIRLGVSATPSFFINGRKYLADMDIETLIDIIEEEIEKEQSREP